MKGSFNSTMRLLFNIHIFNEHNFKSRNCMFNIDPKQCILVSITEYFSNIFWVNSG